MQPKYRVRVGVSSQFNDGKPGGWKAQKRYITVYTGDSDPRLSSEWDRIEFPAPGKQPVTELDDGECCIDCIVEPDALVQKHLGALPLWRTIAVIPIEAPLQNED